MRLPRDDIIARGLAVPALALFSAQRFTPDVDRRRKLPWVPSSNLYGDWDETVALILRLSLVLGNLAFGGQRPDDVIVDPRLDVCHGYRHIQHVWFDFLSTHFQWEKIELLKITRPEELFSF